MKLNGLMAVLVVAGCAAGGAPLEDPGARQYRADDARIRAAEHFERRKAQCARRGRAMVVRRYSSGRLPPREDELRLATC